MEVLIVLGSACALGVLAVLFGHDSRDGFPSEEEALSAFGYAWSGKPGTGQAAARQPAASRRAHAVRHALAVALNVVADWLYPVPLTPEA